MSAVLIIACAVAYVALLFWIAYRTEVRSRQGISIVNNPYIYSLSLAVYCTAWTYFGSVGKAAESGIEFLPIYLGPTIIAPLWWIILRKIILISKSQRITSIADFISSRYGKSAWLGVIAAAIALLSVIPYISIQLKAVAICYDILVSPQQMTAAALQSTPFYLDSALYIAIALAVFTIFFGTRHLDPNERHEGLVAAVAFESLLKLVAFLAIGLYVTYGLFDGFTDLFTQARAQPEITRMLFPETSGVDGTSWFWLIFLSMSAILFLPRQFHIAVVENTNPDFVAQASWLFPFYLFLINIFVIPVAVGGLLYLGSDVDPDFFVLDLPLSNNNFLLGLFVALGGFSAATSMVIVAVIALSIMVSNNLVLPLLLRKSDVSNYNLTDMSGRLLAIRRLIILMVLLLAYGYFRFVGVGYTLVSIGLISFAGVAQFVPVIIGGIFWKRATKAGAIAGLALGFIIWFFCLPLPTLAEAGVISGGFVENGLFGLSLLKPYALMGLDNVDHISHGSFWSLTFNLVAYVTVSLATQQSPLEITQADLFVDIYKYREGAANLDVIRRQASVKDIKILMNRFLGKDKSEELLQLYQIRHKIDLNRVQVVNEDLINLIETHLAGAVGAASAKIMLNTIVKEDPISLEEMFKILEQTQEIVRYSRALEQKSAELEATTVQLQSANEQLKELDRLKADFITTVTHELRTPITSIKALAKILSDNRELPEMQQRQYLDIMVDESERIARLINQVLDLEKIQRVGADWKKEPIDLTALVQESYQRMENLLEERKVALRMVLPDAPVYVKGDKDRLLQVLINLLSNAGKFCDPEEGEVTLSLEAVNGDAVISVNDNGQGIREQEVDLIFEKFAQLSNRQQGKPAGTGLGLPIAKEIVLKHGGEIWVESEIGRGATFKVRLKRINS